MMTNLDITHRRLFNQHLAGMPFEKPSEVVSWLGAVQAQEYAGAKWAVAQRTNGLTDAAIEQAFAEGTLLRTHVMRPTWHFVTPEDIRWLLQLTAPRVQALNAYYYRKLNVDDVFLPGATRFWLKHYTVANNWPGQNWRLYFSKRASPPLPMITSAFHIS